MRNSVDVTGGGTGIGKAAAVEIGKKHYVRLVGGRREAALRETGMQSGVCGYVTGDLFDQTSLPYQTIMQSDRRGIIHCAAINVDTVEGEAAQQTLVRQQTEFLERLVDVLVKNNPANPKLFVDVNSVTAWFAAEIERAKKFPYMMMKLKHAQILRQARVDMQKAGVTPAIVFPGATRTEMMSHIPEDVRAVKATNIFGAKVRNAPGHPDGIVQDTMFTADEIGGSLAALVDYYFVNGGIPKGAEEWIISKHDELKLPAA